MVYNWVIMSKQSEVKERIQQFYFQLTEGCGKPDCPNSNCASNSTFESLSSNDAAVKAIQLYTSKAKLCENSKGERSTQIYHSETDSQNAGTSQTDGCADMEICETSGSGILTVGSDTTLSTWDADMDIETTYNENADIIVACSTAEQKCSDEHIGTKLKNITVGEAGEAGMEVSGSSSAGDDGISSTLINKVPAEIKFEKSYSILKDFCALQSDDLGNESCCLKENVMMAIQHVFSDPDALNNLFIIKEELNSRDEPDKDIDESIDGETGVTAGQLSVDDPAMCDSGYDLNLAVKTNHHNQSPECSKDHEHSRLLPTVDMNCIRTLYASCTKHQELERGMTEATTQLVKLLMKDRKERLDVNKNPERYLNMFVILMENVVFEDPQAMQILFPNFCSLLAELPISMQAILAHYWKRFDSSIFLSIVLKIQQLIAFRVVCEYVDDVNKLVHEDDIIIAASKCLNIFFHAAILGGDINKSVDEVAATASKKMLEKSRKGDQDFGLHFVESLDEFSWKDSLGEELLTAKLDSVKPLIPFSEFVNDALNNCIKVDKDYVNYMTAVNKRFSFLHYHFMLNTVNKITYMLCDNRVRMHSERRRTLLSSLLTGSIINPYLKIQVRRNHIIDDTLVQLELAAENTKDFKKQLYVEFDGEEGVDEGGVSKEFFMLVVEQIFNPENGVFVYDDDTRLFWFNLHSFEGETQYKLIGIVLGLAIYNNCILDVQFPRLVYKKLLGRKAVFEDMQHSHPVMYRSLKSLLEHDGDVEEDMMLTFTVEYEDIFGNSHTHQLKPHGAGDEQTPVTNQNRHEYVELYSDWLLNTSINEQFNALRGGFDLVVTGSPLKYLFDAEELELLVRGSESYDMKGLQATTEYDGGFTASSQTVVDFWSIVHDDLDQDTQRRLLHFSTGCDRAPVGGLAKLKMMIVKNGGPDSNRLPTAHTCFNVILLPDYRDRDKLKERLLKAISYSHGFGML